MREETRLAVINLLADYKLAFSGWREDIKKKAKPLIDEVDKCLTEEANAPLLCEWKFDSEYDYWESGCGHAYVLIDGGLEDNDHHFCPRCGKRIVDVTPPKEVEEDEDDTPELPCSLTDAPIDEEANGDQTIIDTKVLDTINPVIGLPDVSACIGDHSMSTKYLDKTQLGILNTLVQNQIDHDTKSKE